MGRSASHAESASSAKVSFTSLSSSPSSDSQAPQSNVHVNSNKKYRKKGGRTHFKQGRDTEETVTADTNPPPAQACHSSTSSRTEFDFANAESLSNAQKEEKTQGLYEERIIGGGAHVRKTLDNLFIYANQTLATLLCCTLQYFKTFTAWFWACSSRIYEEQKPNLKTLAVRMTQWMHQGQRIIQRSWPPLRNLLMIVGGIALALGLWWLNCAIKGLASIVGLRTGAFFMVICCSLFNIAMLGGFFKGFMFLVLGAAAAFFVGYLYAILIVIIYGGAILWLYGSFWLTGGLLLFGGGLCYFNQPRVALFIGLLYSMYSTKVVGGWLSLFLCLNLSFLFSSLTVSLLHSNDIDNSNQGFTDTAEEHTTRSTKFRTKRGKRSEIPDSMPPVGSSEAESGTLGGSSVVDGESPALDKEVHRLLNCKDHYAVLELSRFAEVDLVALKKDYRKKAMLVHPDKNLGNAAAEEAFKRLQNAYEILLDPLKKQGYDDELKREEMLSALKHFQEEVLRNGRAGTSEGWFTQADKSYDKDLVTRMVACKKCNNAHRWVCTNRNKLRARWCQVDMPVAYACADGKVYEVTEWVHCQGMKCVPNTHKASFHVSTAGIFKTQNRGPTSNKSSSSGKGAEDNPFSHMNENMTEEEFIKWFENAMASGMFAEMNQSTDPADVKSGARAKPSKKKRKGKGKW
ncbi:hypothetical protein KP509_01G023100 [Ceratopteris richardii]|uniref:J domain-containing protein n=1 Tax=Ceratopteris richardii TaxID=49495 RepID=A0A8T2VJM0_CERRI|nr:hypothetical protein KP509_01G023100 [Ceratopteris richardii]